MVGKESNRMLFFLRVKAEMKSILSFDLTYGLDPGKY